jgi:serine protease Do
VDHATLGATVTSDDRGRVVVSNIQPTSDAARRGLRYGDEILSFAGRRITTVNGFKNTLGTLPRGWRVPISFQRAGQRYETYVRLAGVHSRNELLENLPRFAPPHPEEKGEKKPGDEKPEKRDGEAPEGNPPDAAQKPAGPQIPPEVLAILETRAGYANYYFNRQERERVWQNLSAHGTFGDLPSRWTLRGDSPGGRFEIELGEKVLFARLADGPSRVEVNDDLSTQLQPIGSGGLLVALHLWKRFLHLGPEQFGQVYYLGEAPLPQRTELFDVLVGTFNVMECHFYFDRQTGRLAAMEMYSDLDEDPCELYFREYQTVDGRELPAEITVTYGDAQYAELRVTDIEFAADKDKESGPGNETNEDAASGF